MLATENKTDTSALISGLVASGVPFVVYRLPKQEKFRLIVSYNAFSTLEKVDFEELPSGFVFAPFHSSAVLFLQADFEREAGFDQPRIDISDLKCPLELPEKEGGFAFEAGVYESDAAVYQEKVKQVIIRIRNGEARKVVLSRRKALGRITESNYFAAFKTLCNSHSDAMISMTYLPDNKQIWIGASPETLVSQNSEGLFTTMSLAGTQSAFDREGNEIRPIDALWTHKEIEEQAMVSRYIINCLKKIRVREFEEEGPKTVKAGNLLHLRTFYSIDNREVNFPNLSSVMLSLLHPTPAICGMPKENAEKIIEDIEGYDREFYSGYLGPVNVDSESHLFVNLRTLKIEDGTAYVYAGGGITEDSQPDREWMETEMKMDTISRAFDNFNRFL
ncbi:MAG: chorismate-binding protein [Leadbetterella sp.]|nr:chorismate-binding protein [Leadbetterella sp.]